jgi:putative hydrolase of HD superfamily
MGFSLSKPLAEHLFEAFSIQRWNDRIRIIHLNEMDKNAYKLMASYFIAKKYEAGGDHIDWLSFIDRAVYDTVIRISTSDIGSSVHGRLKANREIYVAALNELIESDLKDKIANTEFTNGLKEYVANNYTGNLSVVDYILRLGHNLSVRKEYSFIESLEYNRSLPDHSEKIDELDSEVDLYSKKLKVSEFISSDKFKKLMFSIDSLRFQERWSQTQRIPSTNVLGHSFYVALLYYFSNRFTQIDKRTFRNNFLAALFHDFLESYTRDVINPVKTSSKHFSQQIAEMELEAFDQKVMPILDEDFARHFEFLIKEEFSHRRMHKDGRIEISEFSVDADGDQWQYAEGSTVKVCDSLAALIEAHQSIELGISSRHLEGAITRVYAYYRNMRGKILDVDVQRGFDTVFEAFISS